MSALPFSGVCLRSSETTVDAKSRDGEADMAVRRVQKVSCSCTCKYNSGHFTCCVAAEMPRAGARIAHAETSVFRLIMFVASCCYAGDSCTCVEVESRNKYTLRITATSMISAAIVIIK